ncbi:hypothetical protein HIM_05611 [Hirsutella minnesotensis 3608]|uniref:Nucleoside phosphorylase domain-containing protein n=1 Tax=Hirsutella minnesotensis 3608 TaxID=1043627 RepID=A0A0F7ZP98_9HYPO|nr:hypothetical protein HIM_05611 [Hirsutella minnesotensis 3608]
MPPASLLRNTDFEICIVCALPLEARFVQATFEETSQYDGDNATTRKARKALADKNVYTTGKIGSQLVVLVHMPGMGKVSASAVASDLKHSFGSIKLALLVGICGGAPNEKNDNIVLGDVVVGTEVIQYDFGRQYPDGFKRKDSSVESLGRQNPEIRAFVAKLRSGSEALKERTCKNVAALLEKPGFENTMGPPAPKDDLFPPNYWHMHHNRENCRTGTCVYGGEICEDARTSTCEELKCDLDQLERRRKPKETPDIHFGSIASGDKVMKSGQDRDILARKENVIAFEMEGAGIWDYLPCVIVKGVCDYADSHKNKKWQGYAAMTAAACTKAIVDQWVVAEQPPNQLSEVSFVWSSVAHPLLSRSRAFGVNRWTYETMQLSDSWRRM